MVTIANANMFGSNATINPDGEVDDGIFEICILTEFPKTAGINIYIKCTGPTSMTLCTAIFLNAGKLPSITWKKNWYKLMENQ
jgi:hypothetical protein